MEAKTAASNAGESTLDEIVEKIIAIGEVNVASLDEIKKTVQTKQITPEKSVEITAEEEKMRGLVERAFFKWNEEVCGKCEEYHAFREDKNMGYCCHKDRVVGAFDHNPCFTRDEIEEACRTKQITPEEAEKPPCKECRYFDGKTGDNFGFCFNREEIVGTYDRRLCFNPKGASKVKPKPVEKTCDNCDYSFAEGAEHPGCITGALGFPCGSFKPIYRTAEPITRPAPLGTVTTH